MCPKIRYLSAISEGAKLCAMHNIGVMILHDFLIFASILEIKEEREDNKAVGSQELEIKPVRTTGYGRQCLITELTRGETFGLTVSTSHPPTFRHRPEKRMFPDGVGLPDHFIP